MNARWKTELVGKLASFGLFQVMGLLPLVLLFPLPASGIHWESLPAKAELFKVPALGWMLRMAGDVPVNRRDRRKGRMALLQCARYLRQGLSVVCFPEGTRSRDGDARTVLN